MATPVADGSGERDEGLVWHQVLGDDHSDAAVSPENLKPRKELHRDEEEIDSYEMCLFCGLTECLGGVPEDPVPANGNSARAVTPPPTANPQSC